MTDRLATMTATTFEIASTPALDPDQVGEVLALARDAQEYDRAAPLNEAALLAITEPDCATCYLHARAVSGGRLVGYLFAEHLADGTVQAECVVAPADRRRGIGDALVGALLAAGPDGSAEAVQVWAHGDLPGAATLAAHHDFAPVRTLLRLSRTFEQPVAEPTAPVGVRARMFVPGADDAALLALNARAFAHHPEQGAMSQRDLEQRIGSDWFDANGFFLAERSTTAERSTAAERRAPVELVGFHWTKVGGPIGEVYVLGVDPDAQGLGLGSYLTQLGLHHLTSLGLREVELYVEGDNAPALAVYRKLGFSEAARDVLYRR